MKKQNSAVEKARVAIGNFTIESLTMPDNSVVMQTTGDCGDTIVYQIGKSPVCFIVGRLEGNLIYDLSDFNGTIWNVNKDQYITVQNHKVSFVDVKNSDFFPFLNYDAVHAVCYLDTRGGFETLVSEIDKKIELGFLWGFNRVWSKELLESQKARSKKTSIKDKEKRKLTEGWIYVAELDGCIKVGFSTNVEARLKTYSTSNLKVDLIYKKKATQKKEVLFHKKYNQGNEQYSKHRLDEILKAIKSE